MNVKKLVKDTDAELGVYVTDGDRELLLPVSLAYLKDHAPHIATFWENAKKLEASE